MEQHFPDDEVTSASGVCSVSASAWVDLHVAHRRPQIYLRPTSSRRTRTNSIHCAHIRHSCRDSWELAFLISSTDASLAQLRLARISMYTHGSITQPFPTFRSPALARVFDSVLVCVKLEEIDILSVGYKDILKTGRGRYHSSHSLRISMREPSSHSFRVYH